ncbi:MAG: nuclear transport factor 2 family protein [Acetobacteraceae bacterium]
MNVTDMLRSFCQAVEAGDGAAFAALFTPDGVYHDVFYGTFAGRERIAAMITGWFHRDATDFRWDMHQPVFDGTTLYARYVFSFRSKLPDAAGRRAMFEGVSIMTISDGLIAAYREVADTTPGLVDLGFAPERIARLAARHGSALKARPDASRHLDASA